MQLVINSLKTVKMGKKGKNGHFAVISGRIAQRQSICRDFLHKKSIFWRSGTSGVKRSVFMLVFAHCALCRINVNKNLSANNFRQGCQIINTKDLVDRSDQYFPIKVLFG